MAKLPWATHASNFVDLLNFAAEQELVARREVNHGNEDAGAIHAFAADTARNEAQRELLVRDAMRGAAKAIPVIGQIAGDALGDLAWNTVPTKRADTEAILERGTNLYNGTEGSTK